MSAPSLRRLAAIELRHAPRRAPLAVALVGVLLVPLTHLLLPLLPERAIDLLRRGFRLDDLAGVLVFNDFMAVYFAAFFIGLAGSLGVVLIAREEHRLEILLAKPIRPADFVAARCLPPLLATLGVGVLVALAIAVAVALQPGIGGSVSPAGALGGGLGLTALALVLVAALQLVFVRVRDPFLGLLLACIAWLTTTAPTAVFLYRPDVYAGRERLADALVLASPIWHDAALAWLGPLALLLAVPLAWLLVRGAGVLLARGDVL